MMVLPHCVSCPCMSEGSSGLRKRICHELCHVKSGICALELASAEFNS